MTQTPQSTSHWSLAASRRNCRSTGVVSTRWRTRSVVVKKQKRNNAAAAVAINPIASW